MNVTLNGAEEAKNRKGSAVLHIHVYAYMHMYTHVCMYMHVCIGMSGRERQGRRGMDTLCDGVVAGSYPKKMRVSVTLVQKEPRHVQRNLSRGLGARHLV